MDIKAIEQVPYFMDAFDKWVKEIPHSKMLFDDQNAEGWTREKVDIQSARVYGYLKKEGIGREDFVLICMPRCALSVIAMIGVWKAGAALTVVEDNYAPERIEFIKKDCGCKLTIDMELWEKICEEEPVPGYEKADIHDAAFAVYTSGSSGTPKGVLHEYGNIKLNVLSARAKTGPRTDRNTRNALIAPLNFVAATKTILGLLYSPYCLYIIPYTISKNPVKLRRYYRQQRITNTFLSPSIIRAIGDDISPYLKVVHTGSEPANGIYLKDVELVNNYSMSEGAFTLCQFVIDRSYDVCPVGRPNYDDLEVHLLDVDGKEVPDGETGEICFENPFFRGYINRPEETKETLRGGLYHSGDLAKKDEKGNFILLGRANDMIKINGNRIEPAEIEAAFKKVTGSEWCAAKGFEKPDQSFICLYYQDELAKSEEAIKEEMGNHVPYYMIPAYFVRVLDIPLLPNGKLNRKALPEPMRDEYVSEYAEPVNDLEKLLCDAFAKVLKKERVGANDDFYQMGGDSLSSMMVLVEANLDDLSAMDIFQGKTPRKIAEIYGSRVKEKDGRTPEQVEMDARKYPKPLTSVQLNVFDWQLYNPKETMWNLPQMYILEDTSRTEWLCDIVNKVVKNHPVFSTIFEFSEDGIPQQRYVPELCPEIVIEKMTGEEFEKERLQLVKLHKLTKSRLFNIRLIETEDKAYLYFDPHHAIIDGSGYQALFANLGRAARGEELLMDTFYTYLYEDAAFKQTESYRQEEAWWKEKLDGTEWSGNLEPDIDDIHNEAGMLQLSAGFTVKQMEDFEKRCQFTRGNLFTVAALLAVAKCNSKRNVLTEWVFHNRVDEGKKAAVGILSRTLPLGLKLDEYKTFGEICDEVRKQTTEGIAHSRYEWILDNENMFVNDVLAVVYETASITDGGVFAELGLTSAQGAADVVNNNKASLRRFVILVFETAAGVSPMALYARTIYSDERIRQFDKAFSDIIKALVQADDPRGLLVADLLR